jgi:hypothetical protein
MIIFFDYLNYDKNIKGILHWQQNFDKNKTDFIYRINQKIGHKDLEEFKSILSKTISSIKQNGLTQ